MNRLTFVLSIIAGGLLILLFHGSSRIFGLESESFAQFIYAVPIIGVMSYGILSNRQNLRPALKMLLIWCILIFGAATIYVYKGELSGAAQRIASAIVPGRFSVASSQNGKGTLTISKNIHGHFTTIGSINGHEIAFLIDTGASDVALTYEDAATLGLHPETLSFNRVVSTANGDTVSAPVKLDVIQIGPMIRNNVRASVALEGRLDQSLLGMSFLTTLSGVQITPDQLTLSD